jgi:hypothetical protein
MEWFADTLGVSTTLATVLLVIIVLQLALQAYCLIDLARRPAVAGGSKWVWLAVVLLGNLLGAIVYLAVGRKASAPVEQDPLESGEAPTSSRAASAADLLYGRRDRES